MKSNGILINLNTIKIYHLSISSLCQEADRAILNQFESDDEFKTFTQINGLFLLSVLSNYSGELVKAEDLMLEEFGKPHLNPNKFKEVHFNVSHTKNDIVIATANFPLGIDIELIQEEYPKSILKGLIHLSDQLKVENAEQFYQLWTIKEAFAKFTGEGLRLGLKNSWVSNANLNCLELNSAQQKAQVCAVNLLKNHACFVASEQLCNVKIIVQDHAQSSDILLEYFSKRN